MHHHGTLLSRLRLPNTAAFGLLILFSLTAEAQDLVRLSGELRNYHRLTVRVECPPSACGVVSETSDPNPFTDYRLLVTFTSPGGDDVLQVPGFYAADGVAAYSESTSGNVWIAHFTPHRAGVWTYSVSFQAGADIVLHRDPGVPVAPDGFSGTFEVFASDKSGKDFRAHGFLRYAGDNYFRFSGTGDPFLKNGTGSPENLLHYHGIHNTYQQDTIPTIPAHRFEPHIPDFNAGDPLWGPDRSKGRGIIGALNYLGALDINSYYFIVQNTALDGTGQDTGVWPWIAPDTTSRDRFSVAKLAQWEVVFSHMDSLGIALNMVTQDRINQWDLDGGELGRTRKLFYRELIARFGHHLGLVWNLGEENSATTEQIEDYSDFIRGWDPYQHPIVSQANGTLDAHDRYYTPLLGFPNFDGASMQVGLTDFESTDTPSPPAKIHDAVRKWVEASNAAGRPWVVMLDEIGHWSDGIVPDGDPRDPTNRRARREGFWGTLMAGGAGADWYYGSDPFEYNDLWTEDFSFREAFFRRTRDAVDMILENDVPYWEMENQNAISSDPLTWVFAKTGETYLVYSPYQDTFRLQLPTRTYDIRWYDALAGGPLQQGTLSELTVVSDTAWMSIGAPIGFLEDAVALVTAKPINTADERPDASPQPRALLHPNYPNPVRSHTTIGFELLTAERVTLSVYDMLGRRVRLLADGPLPGGMHQYVLDAGDLPSGLYLYRLEIGVAVRIERALLRLR